MLGMNCWRTVTQCLSGRIAKALTAIALTLLFTLSPVGSHGAIAARKDRAAKSEQKSVGKLAGRIAEAAPPAVIQALQQDLEQYQPQVKILSPKPNQVLTDTTVSVSFQVIDLPIFKNEQFGLGPHLHVLLDNRAYQAVYDVSQPIVFENLEPGTHTIRAFASRPWHESFKNEGAYAQTTFHIFAKTNENSPNPDLPLLTYSRPQGNYGAEPIMLDFYLINAPLHLVAQADPKDDIADWRIRASVNGESFVLDRWQPVYLKGFKPGKNWVQLEFLDEKGNPVPNAFNNTVRLVNYEPNGKDTLSKLVRGEIAIADVRGIVDPNYVPPAPEPEPTPEPIPTPEASPEPSPTPIETPEPEASPEPTPEPSPIVIPTPIETPPTSESPADLNTTPELEQPISPSPTSPVEKLPPEEMNRIPAPSPMYPVPAPSAPVIEPSPVISTEAPVQPGQPQPEAIVPSPVAPTPAQPEPTASPIPAPLESTAPTPEMPPQPILTPTPAAPTAAKPKWKLPTQTDVQQWFDRLRSKIAKPDRPSAQPESAPVAPVPSSPAPNAAPIEPIPEAPAPAEPTPAPITSPEPVQSAAI